MRPRLGFLICRVGRTQTGTAPGEAFRADFLGLRRGPHAGQLSCPTGSCLEKSERNGRVWASVHLPSSGAQDPSCSPEPAPGSEWPPGSPGTSWPHLELFAVPQHSPLSPLSRHGWPRRAWPPGALPHASLIKLRPGPTPPPSCRVSPLRFPETHSAVRNLLNPCFSTPGTRAEDWGVVGPGEP